MFWRNIILVSRGLNQGILPVQTRTFLTTKILRKSHYETLGIKKDATQAEIKNAYFELSKMYHPDRIAATDENLAKFREISDAYEVLGNEHSRKLYDRGLLGEVKRIGIDDAEEIKSPIIEFYRQKHQAGFDKENIEDQWTQELYKSTRKSAFSKNDLYQTKSKTPEYRYDRDKTYFAGLLLSIYLLSTFIFLHAEENILKRKTGPIYQYIK